jgi:hypothetical protein
LNQWAAVLTGDDQGVGAIAFGHGGQGAGMGRKREPYRRIVNSVEYWTAEMAAKALGRSYRTLSS